MFDSLSRVKRKSVTP